MDHYSASDICRLDRLEKRALAHFKAGKARGNLSRLIRAARLETAVNARIIKIMTREVEASPPCRSQFASRVTQALP